MKYGFDIVANIACAKQLNPTFKVWCSCYHWMYVIGM